MFDSAQTLHQIFAYQHVTQISKALNKLHKSRVIPGTPNNGTPLW